MYMYGIDINIMVKNDNQSCTLDSGSVNLIAVLTCLLGHHGFHGLRSSDASFLVETGWSACSRYGDDNCYDIPMI